MTNPTSNFGWQMPTSTDLVTDLPADFEVFGQAVDTRLKALQPGTTLGDIAYSSATANTNTRLPIGTNGQVLAVSGGVPAWTTTADVTPLTTKGDLFTYTTADARLGVGANDTVLTADSSTATGLKWAPSSAPASSYSLLNTGGTALTGATTITVSGITGQQKLMIAVVSASSANANSTFSIRFNADSGSNYTYGGSIYFSQATYQIDNLQDNGATGTTSIGLLRTGAAASIGSGYVFLDGCNSTGIKAFTAHGGASPSGTSGNIAYSSGGVYTGSSTISSVSIISSSGNFDAGTIYVYGSAV